MKNTGICPKCSGKTIIKIRGVAGAYGTGNNIPAGLTIFSAVLVSRYLCGTCGFSEEWIDDPGDLEKLQRKYGTTSP